MYSKLIIVLFFVVLSGCNSSKDGNVQPNDKSTEVKKNKTTEQNIVIPSADDLKLIFADYPWDLEQSEDYKKLVDKGISVDLNPEGLSNFSAWTNIFQGLQQDPKGDAKSAIKNILKELNKIDLKGFKKFKLWASGSFNYTADSTVYIYNILNKDVNFIEPYLVELDYHLSKYNIDNIAVLPRDLGLIYGVDHKSLYKSMRTGAEKFYASLGSNELKILKSSEEFIGKIIWHDSSNQRGFEYYNLEKSLLINSANIKKDIMYMKPYFKAYSQLPKELKSIRIHLFAPFINDLLSGEQYFHYEAMIKALNKLAEYSDEIIESNVNVIRDTTCTSRRTYRWICGRIRLDKEIGITILNWPVTLIDEVGMPSEVEDNIYDDIFNSVP